MSAKKNFMNWESPGTAVITGASSGIGATFARILASQGFHPILIARREEKLEEIAKEIEQNFSISAQIMRADLSVHSEIKKLAEKIQNLDTIDILINNAGFGTKGYFDQTPFKPQIDMLFVHNAATVYLTRAVLPRMIGRGRGVIIFLSSMSSFLPNPQGVMYTATKVFLNGFAESLSLELMDTGVFVQALCPGYTITEFHEKGDYEEHDRSQVPDKMWMSSEEVVSQSLQAFQENKVIFVPGKMNQNLLKLMKDPKYGKKLRQRNIERYRIPRNKNT